VDTLDVVAQAAGVDAAAPLAAVVDARRGQLFYKLFEGDLSPIGDAACHDVDTLAALLPDRIGRLAGDGAGLLAPHLRRPLTAAEVSPDAVDVAMAAMRRMALGDPPRPGYAVLPLYLRAPDARISAGRPLVGAAA
jgi:tRNA A37 threonylcarbamoyladenosine modification protein TsaB